MAGIRAQTTTNLAGVAARKKLRTILLTFVLALVASISSPISVGAVATTPTNLQVSVANTDATATWNPSTSNLGLYGYNVYLDNVFVAFTSSTSHTFTSLSIGEHSVQVEAGDPDGLSAQASKTFPVVGVDTTRPSTPSAFLVAVAGQGLAMSWNQSSDNVAVAGYRIYNDVLNTPSNPGDDVVLTTFGAGGSGSVSVAGGSFRLYVKALDAAGNESWRSNIETVTVAVDTQRPSTPSAFLVAVAGQDLTMTWNLSTDDVGVTGYRVYSDHLDTPSNPSDDSVLATFGPVGSGSVSVAGGSFRLYVKAFDAAGNLSWRSNAETVTVVGVVDTQRPSSPTGFAVTVTGQSLAMTWNQSTDNVAVTGYRIYSDHLGTPSNPADDSVLATFGPVGSGAVSVAGGTFRLYVKAFDAAGNESWRSNAETFTVVGVGTTPRSQAMAGWQNGTWRGANIYQQRYTAGYHDSDNAASAPILPDYTSTDFAGLKAQGANMVVISHAGIFNETPAASQPYYSLDSAVLQNLADVVDDAYAEGLAVVIAMRTGPGRTEFTFDPDEPNITPFLLETVWSDQTAQDGWVDMWKDLANEFKNHPGVIGYDLMVEPNAVTVLGEESLSPQQFENAYAGSLADWDQLQQEIVTQIRTIDSDTPILVEPESWADADWLTNLTDPAEADKIVHSIHIYEPYEYTHNGPGGNGTAAAAAATFAQYVQTAEAVTAQYGTPLAVLELGVVDSQASGPVYLDLILDDLNGQNPHSWAMWLWRSGHIVDDYVDPFSLHKNTPASNPFLTQYRNHWQ